MGSIEFRKDILPNATSLEQLYSDAGWKLYTQDMPKLLQALKHSLLVISVWDGEDLIGLLRAVGDGLTIVYIQDILVKSEYRRQGIAKALLEQAIKDYAHVRQIVLLTDDTPQSVAFYESCALKRCTEHGQICFIKA